MAFGLFRKRVPEPVAAGLAAGRNERAYLIQSYARDMGNGKMVMMREIDVPVRVKGRHWGAFVRRTSFEPEAVRSDRDEVRCMTAGGLRSSLPGILTSAIVQRGVIASEDEMRSNVKDAKAKYEDALREKFFGF
jgi:hypothetical protein